MDLTIVGHCPQCGCPIYSHPLVGLIVPTNFFSCKCQEDKLMTNTKILDILNEVQSMLRDIQTSTQRPPAESTDSLNIFTGESCPRRPEGEKRILKLKF